MQSVSMRVAVFAVSICVPLPVSAGSILGTAQGYSVLGGSAVTNTDPTTLNGDLGVFPGSSITGAGSITFIGASAIHNTPAGLDPISEQAQADETNAYNVLAAEPSTMDLTGQTLGSGGTIGTLGPGVYKFDSSAQLDGTLTLDATSGGLFIFQIGTTLTTASASSVVVTDGNANVGVFWQVGSSATLGTTTAFEGNILALDSITLNTAATILCGRALAQTGAVTTDTNVVSNNCSTFNNDTGSNDFGSSGFSGGAVPGSIPEPGTMVLLGGGLLALMAARRRLSREKS